MGLFGFFNRKRKGNVTEPRRSAADLLTYKELIGMLYDDKRPSKQSYKVDPGTAEKALTRYQELMTDPNNKDFFTELSSWYLMWSNGQYDQQKTPDVLMEIGYVLQTCDCGGIGGFERCIDLFHSGIEFTPFEKLGIIAQAVKMIVLTDEKDQQKCRDTAISLITHAG